MSNHDRTYQVVIIGGGPVGLFLGICLVKAGISCQILEKRAEPRSGSRSLGIHPVSLEIFNEMGIANDFVNAGIKISKGYAFANDWKIGTLSFESCPKPFNYILALPQHKTERLLEESLSNIDDQCLTRNATVTDISENDEEVEVTYQVEEQVKTIRSRYVVGCDGKKSYTRQQMNIDFRGESYPDTYIMGDFEDNTTFGSDAAIFLCQEGLIESFPLLNNRRRWVVKTDNYFNSLDRKDIDQRIAKRIGHNLGETEHFMLSSFGVQKLIAQPMVKNRVILVGDAAHIVSPIGGQGMNLGWLGARDLADSLNRIVNEEKSPDQILKNFERRRKKAARNAIRRGEMNMRLGRKSNMAFLRNSIVWAMLNTPLSHLMARLFTMRGIERWPV